MNRLSRARDRRERRGWRPTIGPNWPGSDRTVTPTVPGLDEHRPSAERPAPAFLFGFPRSGTTLLDTMLTGHPDALVLEERPILHAVAEALGPPDRLAGLGPRRSTACARLYFERARPVEAGDGRRRLVIDKLPLGIVDTALVHRIFPDARFVFVERHPCDVVLSCFMTRFDPKGGMANLLGLGMSRRSTTW